MSKSIQILIIILTLSACGRSSDEMKTPINANEKFAEFIAKEKFLAEKHFPGIADEKMRPINTEKINQVASEFKILAESDNPTDEKYQEKLELDFQGSRTFIWSWTQKTEKESAHTLRS
nr:DUF4844 domain-containing protein [Nonlabens tegetincola]